MRTSEDDAGHGRGGRALASSVRGNSTAFGFSIVITVSFGVLSELRGKPVLLEMLLYGVAAALTVGMLEAVVTRGFRVEFEQVAQRTDMLGTAMNFVSVAAAVGAVAGIGELFGGTAAWPLGAFAATSVYMLIESAEIFAAERIEGEG